MDSWRFQFIDIDQSFNVPVADSAIQGYMVCRAPKGSTQAVYFPKGSTNQIMAMCGIPTADWPDIQDALDLNGTYGLWISAPPGASASYPSYFGGVYLTRQGLFPFHQVTDRTKPSFQVLINPESEDTEYIHLGGESSQVGATTPTTSGDSLPPSASNPYTIFISGIPDEIQSAAIGLNFNFWGNSNAPVAYASAANYQLVIADHNIQVANPADPSGGFITIGQISQISGSGNVITLSGTTAQGPSSFMYLDMNQLVDSTPYVTNGAWTSLAAENTYLNLLHQALVGSLEWIIDVSDSTYMAISQLTPTEKETLITISDIGYDKYNYDFALDAYAGSVAAQYVADEALGTTFVPGTNGPYVPNPADVENAGGLYVVFPTASTGRLYLSTGSATAPKDVTSQYRNKYIRIANAGIQRDSSNNFNGSAVAVLPSDPTQAAAMITAARDSMDVDPINGTSYIDQIYFINSSSQLQLCATSNSPQGTVAPRKASNYNQVTFSVVEDVYPGDAQSGGTFTGSLSTQGVNGSGGNIYFPNVIPANALTDVIVTVYKTFDSDINAAGFYTGDRVIDAQGRIFNPTTLEITTQPLPSSVTTGKLGVPAVKGQRYVTSVVNALIANGENGGTIDPNYDFTSTLLEGWIEAAKTVYEPVPVFAEPTGIEAFKEVLFNLRVASHKFATMVSPRLIDTSEANDPTSIIVSGRITGTAQIVNRANRSDSYTGEQYYTALIGAYAANLLLIIDGKLGGWAPMWTNVGGYGGQLPIAVNSMEYEFSQDQLEAFDTMGLNPLVLDSQYGLMVESQKTTQDPDNLSDWSYLGHTMAFDLLQRQIRDNVMVPQIGKPNDSYYQAMRQRQVQALLNLRIGGTEPIWGAGSVEVANVNTPDVLAARSFAIRVTVRVNIFSEKVILTFVNVAQGVSVTQG